MRVSPRGLLRSALDVPGTAELPVRYWMAGAAILLAWAALASLVAKQSLLTAAALAIAPAVIAVVATDVMGVRGVHGSSLLASAAVAVLPLLMIVVQSAKVLLLVQGAFGVLVVLLVASLGSERRDEWARQARLVGVLGLVFGVVIALSHVSSGVRGLEEAAKPVSLLLAAAFFVMPLLIVDGSERFERLIGLLLVVSVLQVVVVVAQSAGLTASLPGPLANLDLARWHDPLSATSVEGAYGGTGRYTGTFGDYELLAEYASIVTILGTGLFVISRHKRLRLLGLACAAAAVTTGVFTGTRSYAIAVVIGLGVLLLTIPTDRPRTRLILTGRVAAAVVLLVGTLYTVIPDSIRDVVFERFTELTTTSDMLNRGYLWISATRAVARMPLLGYGARMADALRVAGSGFGFRIESPHSLYFWVLLTAGIPALAALLLLVAGLAATYVRALIREQGEHRRWFAVFVGVLAAWLANEYKIEAVRSPLYVDWLLFVMGMPLALLAVRPSAAGIEGEGPPAAAEPSPSEGGRKAVPR